MKMWEVSTCIRNITMGHTCNEQQSTRILPEYVDTFRIDRVDYWQYEKVYGAGCIGVKQYGQPGSAIRLSETVKVGERQQWDIYPADN